MECLLDRLHFTVDLKLKSDLHVGTGERKLLSSMLGRPPPIDPETAVDPEVACIARDHFGEPIVPATAIKSALRRAFDSMSADRMFGSVKATGGAGNIGCVWLEAATWKSSPCDCPDLPHWDQGQRRSFIQTHVAIERATRTAAEQKLYCIERVPAGTIFALSGDVLAPKADAIEMLKSLVDVLANGIALGADERHGAGRAVLDGGVTCVRHFFDAGAASYTRQEERITVTASGRRSPSDRTEITLECLGPYVSLDTTRNEGNTRGAFRRSAQQPLLNPASLLGALRSRCAWLSHIHCSEESLRGDEPFRKAIPRSDIALLTATERLFGVNGWRGLVRLVSLTLEGEPASRPYTSVALDRFTQGPLDEALFSTEFSIGNRLVFALALEMREGYPTQKDLALFDKLVTDLNDNGLMLGHATNKGFGWFEPLTVPSVQTRATPVPAAPPPEPASQSAGKRAEIDPKTGKVIGAGKKNSKRRNKGSKR